jgi:hypothetical protein
MSIWMINFVQSYPKEEQRDFAFSYQSPVLAGVVCSVFAGDVGSVFVGEVYSVFAGDVGSVFVGEVCSVFAGNVGPVFAGEVGSVLAGAINLAEPLPYIRVCCRQ